MLTHFQLQLSITILTSLREFSPSFSRTLLATISLKAPYVNFHKPFNFKSSLKHMPHFHPLITPKVSLHCKKPAAKYAVVPTPIFQTPSPPLLTANPLTLNNFNGLNVMCRTLEKLARLLSKCMNGK